MKPRDSLLGALIGLANAISGNEEMTDSGTISLICEAIHADTEIDAMIERVRTEKFRIAPGCAACKHPCGRTSDFDMELLYTEPEDTRNLKLRILEKLRDMAANPAQVDAEFLLRGLRAIGEYWDAAGLLKILQ